LVLAQVRDLQDLHRQLEAMRRECEVLRCEVAKQDQQVRHLVQDLRGAVEVLVAQSLDDREAEGRRS
jgi:hypothetical protein